MRKINLIILLMLLGACTQPQLYGAKHPTTNAAVKQASQREVIVQRGDTIYTVSQRYNIGMWALINANGLEPPFQLRPGQRLALPSLQEHIVQKGESVSLIAKRNGLETEKIIALNNLRPPYTLRIGQKLLLGGEARPAVVTASTSSPQAQVATPAPREDVAVVNLPAPQPRPKPEPSIVASSENLEATPVASAEEPVLAPKPTALPLPAPRSQGKFLWPVKGEVLVGFGNQAKGINNDGLNIAIPVGTPVKAAENGVVAYIGNELRGYGNLILIKHSGGWVTAYAHNAEILAKKGDKITRGQVIAKSGESGNTNRPQLHFEVRKNAQPLDPLEYLEG